jgi:hypothetical protein
MHLSPVGVAVVTFVLGGAISFVVAAIIKGIFGLIRLTGKAPASRAGRAPEGT